MAAAGSQFLRQALSSSSSSLPLPPSISRNPKPSKFQFPVGAKPVKPRQQPFSLFFIPQPSPAIFFPHLENVAALDQYDRNDPDREEDEEELNFDFEDENQQTASCSTASTLLPEGIVGEIAGHARNLQADSTLREELRPYEGKISTKQCEEALEILAKEEQKESMLMSCLSFFEWMSSQQPPLVTRRACTTIFPLLGKARLGDELIFFFENLPLTNEFRDVHVYNAAMSGLLNCGRYDDACKVYETMKENNIRPSHITCHVMITIMRKQGRSAKEAWDFFQRMNRKGVKWSTEVLGALIVSFCHEGLMEEALIILSNMQKEGVAPDVVVYNSLMNAYSKSNQVEEAEGLFEEMKSVGIRPTSDSFNVLMDAYSQRKQPEIVEKLIEEMQNVGLKPDSKSFTALIRAYGSQKRCDLAEDALLRMKKAGIKPTAHSYTILFHAYSVCRQQEKAYAVFEDIKREGVVRPGVETYTALLNAFRRAGDAETLMEIWKQMRSDKVEGTQLTFTTLVDGFAKRGLYLEAREVIREFGKLGFRPTVMTYNMLMNAYARGGEHSKLPQLLKEMSARNLRPDSVTYQTMIYAFVRVGDFKRAFFYHKEMVKSGQLPNAKSYEKLKKELTMKAKMKNGEDRSAILGMINSTIGLKTKKKEKKDEFWKNKRNNYSGDVSSSRGR